MRDALVAVVEAAEGGFYNAQARHRRVLDGAGEEGLKTDTNGKEGLPGIYVTFYGGEVTGGGELGHAVTEVADARQDEFLGVSEHGMIGRGEDLADFSFLKIFG